MRPVNLPTVAEQPDFGDLAVGDVENGPLAVAALGTETGTGGGSGTLQGVPPVDGPGGTVAPC